MLTMLFNTQNRVSRGAIARCVFLVINNNNSPKWRWLVLLDIYQGREAAS